ncbi:MAG: hypothetical protein WC307_05800 [Candidatus Nanoarchaeia archaeon]|jgi:hypothetical protein
MIIKVYAWIPRSYVHIAEITEKIKRGVLNDKITSFEDNGLVSFKVKEYEGYKDLSFVLDGDGLYSVSIKLPEVNPEKTAKDFYMKARNFIMNEIIKNFHKVTYTQIIEGVLPINYSTITMMSKEHQLKDYNKKRGGGLIIYSDSDDNYMKDTFTFISGSVNNSVEQTADFYAFTNIISHFFYEMMNKMEQYHNGTKEVIRLLEYEPNSKLINSAYLNLDLVKKDATESWAKVEQAIDCLIRKKNSFDSMRMSAQLKLFASTIGVTNNFIKLSADRDYILSLWTLLINHLEHVDTAVEARINYKSMINNRTNQWLSLINTGFILAAVLIGLFMINSGALNNIYNFIALIITWVITYEASSYFILKKNH